MELVSELLDGITLAVCELALVLVKSPSFGNEILVTGKKCGWDVLKPPMQSTFYKLSSSGNSFDSYNLFLSKFSQQRCSEVQKNVC